jgi:hypothetical protein
MLTTLEASSRCARPPDIAATLFRIDRAFRAISSLTFRANISFQNVYWKDEGGLCCAVSSFTFRANVLLKTLTGKMKGPVLPHYRGEVWGEGWGLSVESASRAALIHIFHLNCDGILTRRTRN